jgi:hypothetical protein
MFDAIASGCSFTKQSFYNQNIIEGSSNYNSFSWPEWITHDKKIITKNLGNQTNDNISICRTILYNLDYYNPKYVFIQWSAESRYPFFIGDFTINEMHTLNYVNQKGYSFGLTGSGIGDNLEVSTHNNFKRLSLDFLTLNETPINQVLHWFEIWCFLIKEMETRNIVRRYFSMDTINYKSYLDNPLFIPYKEIIENELNNNFKISSAIDYSNDFYGKENQFDEYLLKDMESVIFTELYNENPSKSFFENELKTRKRVGGHPSSIVYRKLINEKLYL